MPSTVLLVLNSLDELGLIPGLDYFDELLIPKLKALENQSALKVKLFGALASQCHPNPGFAARRFAAASANAFFCGRSV
jgi:hypothetical protein